MCVCIYIFVYIYIFIYIYIYILNSDSGRQEMFFQGVFIVLLVRSGSSASSFYFCFTDSMNFGEPVIYCDLERLFICGSIPVLIA